MIEGDGSPGNGIPGYVTIHYLDLGWHVSNYLLKGKRAGIQTSRVESGSFKTLQSF